MGTPWVTDEDLAGIQDAVSGALPDELRVQTEDTTSDGLGHTVGTGTYTTTVTTFCHWQELTGRELEIARSLAAEATHRVRCPVGTTVAVGQRIQVYQAGVLALTARVLWVITGSFGVSVRLLCQEVNP